MFIVFDSWEWIEREYVLVPVNCISMEMLSSLEKSTKDDTGTRNSSYDRSTGKSLAELLVYKTMGVLQCLLPMSQPMWKIEEGSHLIVLQGFIF